MFPRPIIAAVLALLLGLPSFAAAADEPQSHVIKLLAEGKPAIGIWTGAINAPRIAKVLATSDADFIVADVEHEIYDFNALHSFLLEVPDFSTRYRATAPRPTPGVLVKLAHRAGWDPRYEISEAMRVGPALGVVIPIVENRGEVEEAVATFHQAEQAGLEGMNVTAQGMHTGVSVLWPQNPQGHALIVAMIETEEGARHAEEIISTPGLSAIHAVHLSDADDANILALCKKYHVIAGIDATPQDVKAKVAAGWQLISLGWDFDMLKRQLDDTLKSVRSAVGGK